MFWGRSCLFSGPGCARVGNSVSVAAWITDKKLGQGTTRLALSSLRAKRSNLDPDDEIAAAPAAPRNDRGGMWVSARAGRPQTDEKLGAEDVMEDVFRFADELGPLKLVHIHRSHVGLKAVVAIENIACGPAIGGVRMAPDVSAEEAFRLARAMTFKNAAAGLPHGGGKSVIFADPKMPSNDKQRLIRAFATAIADLVDYIPGPDMGTDELAMGWIEDETGRAVGLPRELGGIPLDEIGATGFGLAAAIDVARQHIALPLARARVVVQGFGSVGKHAARLLAEKGAVLIAASDSRGTIADENGLDVAALIALKASGRALHDHPSGRKLDRDAVIDIPCDIWIPAARPDVIHAGNVARLQTRLVAEAPTSRSRSRPNRHLLPAACSCSPILSPMPAA
jgi:glutamate dehydrogenase (NAD(P)+)